MLNGADRNEYWQINVSCELNSEVIARLSPLCNPPTGARSDSGAAACQTQELRAEGDVWSHTITSQSEIHPPSWNIRKASVQIPRLEDP